MYSEDISDTPTAGHGGPPAGVDPLEWEHLLAGLTTRFAPHIEAAAAAVREAQQQRDEARRNLERARSTAAGAGYRSDRLVFMRASVHEEAEGLTRKTTTKKAKVAYRYLLARAVELAEAEVQGYRDDLAAAEWQRAESVEACERAEAEAVARLEAAQAMQQRVIAAQATARDGLVTMLHKSSTEDSPQASA